MTVSPHSGIIDFGTFTSPVPPNDGIQGEVPAPLSAQNGYILSTSGWIPNTGGGGGVSAIGYAVDGGGDVITTGVVGVGLRVPFACTINEWTLQSDVSGSIVVDIWKDTYSNYPPTVLDTITGSAKPTISNSNKNTSSTLTGWTTSITAGDILYFNIDSCSTIKSVLLTLKVTKT